MNSIAGIYRFDGRAVEPDRLASMLAHLPPAMAGPLDIWHAGPVGLAVAAPAAIRGAKPRAAVVSAADCRVAADARIDNRREVEAVLRLDAPAAPDDAALIAAGYAKWGDDLPAHLVGDYAFALWDAAQGRLFCARDHFGQRPFFYHLGPRCFAFASDLRGVLACPEVGRDLDEVRIGFHLAVVVGDKESTFYRAVKRLAPAHSLMIESQGRKASRRYWALEAAPELPQRTRAAHGEAFHAVFMDAVRCRLTADGPLGVLLSGGLDSTAVACAAHELMQARAGGDILRSYSAVFDQTPECDERPYIAATLQRGGIEAQFVQVEAQSPLAQIDAMLAACGEPFSSPTMYILWQLYQAAHSRGTAVLLDGIDGDTAVHHGDAYLADLAQGERWDEFFAQAHKLQTHGAYSVDRLMQRYGEPQLVGLIRAGRWGAWQRAVRTIAPYSSSPERRLWSYYGLRPLTQHYRAQAARVLGKPPAAIRRPEIVGERLWHETHMAERIAANPAHAPVSAQAEHYRLLEAPLLAHVFELSSHVSRAFAIDTRHPFADRRLVEFCYALPPEHKLVDGWTRHIVRQGLAGLLPDAVRLRGGKTENSAAVTKALRSRDAACLAHIMARSRELLGPYADLPALDGAYRRYQHSGNRQDEMFVWQAATLAIWLGTVG